MRVLRGEKDPDRRAALIGLQLAAAGTVASIDALAERLGVEADVVTAWFRQYADGGLRAFGRVDTNGEYPRLAPRVLLGEGDELVASIVEARLAREGIQVERANDGMQLVSLAEASVPDLFVVDLRLSGLDGFQIARWVRSDKMLAAKPVILLGWPGKETDVADAFQAGADDFILKPFSPIDLAARVCRLLDHRMIRSPAFAASGASG